MISNQYLERFRRDQTTREGISGLMAKAAADWSARPATRCLLDDLQRYGRGLPLRRCAVLQGLFSQSLAAKMMIDEWLATQSGVLTLEPLAQPSFHYQVSRGATIVSLAKSGTAELSLVCFDNLRSPNPDGVKSAQFADVERHEVILAGSAEALFIRRTGKVTGPQSFTFDRRLLQDGDVISHYGSLEAKCFERIHGRFVFLRLSRTKPDAGPVREYRFRDGALLCQASGNKRESCREMMMTVLGRMGRSDAVPEMAKIAITGDDHMRWEAMRHCLSLDSRRGFAILSGMARSNHDPLALQAGALRAQLIETYPQLAELENAPCPA